MDGEGGRVDRNVYVRKKDGQEMQVLGIRTYSTAQKKVVSTSL